jgi:RimJ/RimL family protein N-acetyltransferase
MDKLSHWYPRPRPGRTTLEGRYCRIEPIDPVRHGSQLFVASMAPGADDRFRYLPEAPQRRAAFDAWLAHAAVSDDPKFYAIVDMASGRCLGRQSYARIVPEHGSVAIADILWGPAMSRTRLASEALFLFAGHVLDHLGYRRVEWSCDAEDKASQSAATRFGFVFEGTCRRHMVTKGRSRDTVLFAITDVEWPTIRAGFERWLDPSNFDRTGNQRARLEDLRAAARRKTR